jgi:hypothetical protein
MPLQDWDDKATWDAAYHKGAEGDTGHPGDRPEVKLHYVRYVQYQWAANRAQSIATALGWTPPGPTIAIVGAGYGWTVEALEQMGYDRVVGLDVSAWIQDEHDLTDEQEIDAGIIATGLDPTVGEGADLKARFYDGGTTPGSKKGGKKGRTVRGVKPEDGRTPGSRNKIRSTLGLSRQENVEWGLSEAVLESLTDQEALDETAFYREFANNIAHFVFTAHAGQDPGFNWKTLEGWRALFDSTPESSGDLFVEAGSYRVL